MLHQREPVAGLRPFDHQPHSDAPQEPGLAVARTHHLHRRRSHLAPPLARQDCRGKCLAPSAICVKIDRTAMTDQKRVYRKLRRAEHEAETRRRITESAMELHGTVGPSRTSISAVAARAGVRRSTVYRHFPDEAALFAACSSHWAALNPPPDLEAWAAILDPEARLASALLQLYGY